METKRHRNASGIFVKLCSVCNWHFIPGHPRIPSLGFLLQAVSDNSLRDENWNLMKFHLLFALSPGCHRKLERLAGIPFENINQIQIANGFRNEY